MAETLNHKSSMEGAPPWMELQDIARISWPYRQQCEKNRKFEIWDLDLRIARIDPSRQVSMDEPCQSENEWTGIVNIRF